MRKFLFFAVLLAVVLALPILSNSMEVNKMKLGNGEVQIYDFGKLRLHTWQTGDPMFDECFILETPQNLVALEAPPFYSDMDTWKKYMNGLNKPLTDILFSAHIASNDWYGKAKTHATEATAKAMRSGGLKDLVEYLGKTYGKDFATTIPAIDSILVEGKNSTGSIPIVVTQFGDSFNVAIPEASAFYTHMLGADSHSLFSSKQNMDGYLAMLEDIISKGYSLILSGHHTPETPKDVQEKIGYVRKTKEILGQSKDKQDFISRMKKEFPTLGGENYLEMTAENLFKN